MKKTNKNFKYPPTEQYVANWQKQEVKVDAKHWDKNGKIKMIFMLFLLVRVHQG